jgi:hypothetical protein
MLEHWGERGIEAAPAVTQRLKAAARRPLLGVAARGAVVIGQRLGVENGGRRLGVVWEAGDANNGEAVGWCYFSEEEHMARRRSSAYCIFWSGKGRRTPREEKTTRGGGGGDWV